jgi:integrase/recombinase XerD
VRRGVHDVRAALNRLLEALRADGILPSRVDPAQYISAELARFDAFMRDAGGLAVTTRARRCRILGAFLAGEFDAGPIVVATIKPLAIRLLSSVSRHGW